MNKNVALFIPELQFGGAERVVQRLSYIINDSYNLCVIVFNSGPSKYECGCRVIDMGIPAKRSYVHKIISIFKRVSKLNQIIKNNKIDVVISFLDGANMINLLSKRGSKKIVSIRNYKKSEKDLSLISKASDLLINKLYHRADTIVPVSQLLKLSLVEDYKVNPDKLKVIHNPFDIAEIEKMAGEELDADHSAFYTNSKVMVTVGRKVYQKGFWHLVKAFSLVKKRIANARLVIVGDGKQDAEITKLINDLHLSGEVLLTGHQANPFKYIQKSELYVMSSLFEGFPNSLVEAMACGKPILSTDCKSGPREILYRESSLDQTATGIEYADYGILVPPLTNEENWKAAEIEECQIVLSEAMIHMLNDDDCKKRYSEQALERAKDFNNETCKVAFDSIIN